MSNTDYVDNIVRTKWLKKLEEKEREFYDNFRNPKESKSNK